MKVLVAVDDNECSRVALEGIKTREWGEAASCKLVSVIEPFDMPVPHQPGQSDYSAVVDSIRKKRQQDGEKLLENAAEQLQDCFSSVETAAIKDFNVDQAIINAASDWEADLIVTGSRDKHGLKKLLLGSVSHSVMLHSACSVLIVKPPVPPVPLKVLIAWDGSEFAEAAFDTVLARPWLPKTSFKLISVVKAPISSVLGEANPLTVMGNLSDSGTAAEMIRGKLEERAKKLSRRHGESPVESEVLEGDARACILQAIDEWQAGLVVVGSQGRTALSSLLLGSVSMAVAMHSRCSIEIVKSTPQEED